MPEKIIILSGARQSGKSNTLEALQQILTYVGQLNFYEYNGKRICIFRTSPQEMKGVRFCVDADVSNRIDGMIAKCDSGQCRLLILPFSLRTNRSRQLNMGCIERPIERLRSRFEVHLVYLRRETNDAGRPLTGLVEMDDLMRRLNAETIIRSRQRYQEQARELLAIIDKVDP